MVRIYIGTSFGGLGVCMHAVFVGGSLAEAGLQGVRIPLYRSVDTKNGISGESLVGEASRTGRECFSL